MIKWIVLWIWMMMKERIWSIYGWTNTRIFEIWRLKLWFQLQPSHLQEIRWFAYFELCWPLLETFLVGTHSSGCCSQEPLHDRLQSVLPPGDMWLLVSTITNSQVFGSWSLPADLFRKCTGWLFEQAVLLIDSEITHDFSILIFR